MSAPKLSATDVDHLVELYAAGQSVKALAEAFRVDRVTVTKRLRERGVTVRGISEAQRLVFATWTPERRREVAAHAFEARRGRPNSHEQLCAAALTRQLRGVGVQPSETRLAGWLLERGVTTRAQVAVGPYNCDLAAGPVAVEVFGGNFHASGRHAATFPERADYLLDRGWHLVIAWDQARDPLSVGAADYVVTFLEGLRRDPPAVGQYRVVRGCGEELARGEGQFDQRALVPSQRRTPRGRA